VGNKRGLSPEKETTRRFQPLWIAFRGWRGMVAPPMEIWLSPFSLAG